MAPEVFHPGSVDSPLGGDGAQPNSPNPFAPSGQAAGGGRGRRYGKPADVYSFAIIMWELAALERPFSQLSPFQIGWAVAMRGDRPEPSPAAPQGYLELMRRCWAQDPDSRPPFEEALHCLESLQADEAALRKRAQADAAQAQSREAAAAAAALAAARAEAATTAAALQRAEARVAELHAAAAVQQL